MDIYARCGTKVKFGTLNAGYEYQQKDIVKHLKLGEIYTVDHTVVHDSSTEVFFKEAHGIPFNSVFFEDMDTGSRIVNFWYKHGKWASETYGAQRDHIGPLKHLAKEAVEAQVIPADPIELADCFMLVLSATRNAGLTLEDLITAAENKLEICKTRKYPKGVNGEPIEHDRSLDEPSDEKRAYDALKRIVDSGNFRGGPFDGMGGFDGINPKAYDSIATQIIGILDLNETEILAGYLNGHQEPADFEYRPDTSSAVRGPSVTFISFDEFADFRSGKTTLEISPEDLAALRMHCEEARRDPDYACLAPKREVAITDSHIQGFKRLLNYSENCPTCHGAGYLGASFWWYECPLCKGDGLVEVDPEDVLPKEY